MSHPFFLFSSAVAHQKLVKLHCLYMRPGKCCPSLHSHLVIDRCHGMASHSSSSTSEWYAQTHIGQILHTCMRSNMVTQCKMYMLCLVANQCSRSQYRYFLVFVHVLLHWRYNGNSPLMKKAAQFRITSTACKNARWSLHETM